MKILKIIVYLLVCSLQACSNARYLENNEAARANAKLAHAYVDHAQYPAAKAKLLEAARQAPHDPFVWNGWAYYADATGGADEADVYYQRAIHLEPRWGMLHNNYGVFLCRQARYQAALSQFNQAISDPNYLYPEQAYRNAAICAERAHRPELAQSYRQKAHGYQP